MAHIVLITGLSGAGRSGAADVLEDLGWYVVDNLPTSLVEKIVELAAVPGAAGIDKLALVAGRDYDHMMERISAVRAAGHQVTVVFLDANSSELVRRYDATRRRHPLTGPDEGLLDAIERERKILQPVRDAADLVIDTSDLNVHQLKHRLVGTFTETGSTSMQVTVESFGFKHGLPLDADIVMDVRFLPNPHWQEELRPLTGLEEPVRAYVLGQDQTTAFLEHFEALLNTVLPGYQAEGRTYLTVAIGCTGGHHRSVTVTEELARRLRGRGIAVRTAHRDVSR